MQVKSINIIFFITLFLLGCNKNVDDDTLVKVFVENLIVQERYYNNSQVLEIKKQEIFKKYNIDESKFMNSLLSLKYDRDKWNNFIRKSNDLLYDLKNSGAIN